MNSQNGNMWLLKATLGSILSVTLAGSVALAELSPFLFGGIALGTKISKKKLTEKFSFAETYATPALQIGPRVFLTCGHCITEGSTEDANRYTTEQIIMGRCEEEIERFKDGETLDTLAFKSCLVPEHDLGLIVYKNPVPNHGKVATVSFTDLTKNDSILFLGSGRVSVGSDYCKAKDSRSPYRFAQISVNDVLNGTIFFSGIGLNGQKVPHSCPGDSGGHYFKENLQGNIEVVGVHGWGSPGGPSNRFGRSVVVPPLFGGTSLGDPKVKEWILKVIEAENAEVCGVNIDCPSIKW